MQVGSLPWLLHFEWQLWCRDPRGLKAWLIAAKYVFGLFAISLCICISWLIFAAFNDYSDTGLQAFKNNFSQDSNRAFWTAVGCLSYFSFFSFLDTLTRFCATLTQGTKLELPRSSPINPHTLFTAQCCTLTVQSLWVYGLTLLIAICSAVLMQSVQPLLGIALVGLQLTVVFSILAMWCLVLASLLGVQRTYRALNLLIGFLLWGCAIGCIAAILWIDWKTLDIQELQQLWQHYFINNFWWGREGWLWLPARALLLEPQAIWLMTLLVGGLALFTYKFLPTTTLLTTLQQSQHLQRKSSVPKLSKVFIRGVTQNIVLKEWRSLQWRSQLFNIWRLLALTLLAVMALAFSPQEVTQLTTPTNLLMGLTTLIGAFLASTLTSRCIAREEAMEWLASAPVQSHTLRQGKLLAILSLIWLALTPAILLSIVLGESWWVTAFVVLSAPVSQTLLHYWNAIPLKEKEIVDIYNTSALYRDEALMYLTGTSMVLWAVCGPLLASDLWAFGILVMVLELGLMRVAYRRSCSLGASLIPY